MGGLGRRGGEKDTEEGAKRRTKRRRRGANRRGTEGEDEVEERGLKEMGTSYKGAIKKYNFVTKNPVRPAFFCNCVIDPGPVMSIFTSVQVGFSKSIKWQNIDFAASSLEIVLDEFCICICEDANPAAKLKYNTTIITNLQSALKCMGTLASA